MKKWWVHRRRQHFKLVNLFKLARFRRGVGARRVILKAGQNDTPRARAGNLHRTFGPPHGLANMSVGEIYDKALRHRDEKAAVDQLLAVKASIAQDRVANTIAWSSWLAARAENGLDASLHTAIRPFKGKKSSTQLLLCDQDGRRIGSRDEQALAIKEFLSVRAKGHITTFAEHLEKHRLKRMDGDHSTLSAEAVVGALDSRQQAAKSKVWEESWAWLFADGTVFLLHGPDDSSVGSDIH